MYKKGMVAYNAFAYVTWFSVSLDPSNMLQIKFQHVLIPWPMYYILTSEPMPRATCRFKF